MRNAKYDIEKAIEIAEPHWHNTLKSSLEEHVDDESPLIGDSFLERLVTDKTKSQKASVKALLHEIELRENLNSCLLLTRQIFIPNSCEVCYRTSHGNYRHKKA